MEREREKELEREKKTVKDIEKKKTERRNLRNGSEGEKKTVITIYYLFLGYYKGELKILRKNLFSRGVSKLFCQFFTPSFSEG